MELELKKLTKKYKEKVAVDHVDTVLNTGIYGLLGANGAGKTTLMRMICDVLTPTSGEVLVDGNRVTAMGENYRSLLGYLPQNFGYYPDYSAKEFMYYIAALKGISKSSARKQTRQLLELVSMTNVAGKKIKTFSGGMIQRLGIAQALLGNPRILILDEPTAGLDPKERVRFRNLIAEFAKDRIIILSTHIASDVEYIADHILLMKNGAFLLSGPTQSLIHTLDKKVWSCQVSEHELDKLESVCTIVNLHHNGTDGVNVRLVSDKKPFKNAMEEEPSLEDLYLYCFRDNDCVKRVDEKCLN